MSPRTPTGAKFALVSHALPPACSGQSVVLARLLRDLPATSYCLLTGQAPAGDGDLAPLPAPTTRFAPAPWRPRGLRGVAHLEALAARARVIARVALEEGCAAVVACTGDILDIPAAALASRRLRLPFFAYMFDDYVCQWPSRRRRLFARAAETLALRDAAAVIVPNELMAEAYERRHGLRPVIVRNPFDPALQGDDEPPAPSPASAGLRVVYTGSVYHAQLDELRRLAAALADVPGASLHLYTGATPAALRDADLTGPVTTHGLLSPREAVRAQRAADVLFLPLAFRSRIPEVIRTSAPGKLGEYLRAGRPILVHAPADSFVARFFRERGCGLVVDRPEPAALVAALRRVRDEPGRVAELAARARAAAEEFALPAARAAFLGALTAGSAPTPL
ncbi:MAG: hypothetical protein KF878_10435 [Planctomycetes bacterium]|nr:hypothetical protein [Planctomycetota bacterium]